MSEQTEIKFKEKDIEFIGEKVCDFMGDIWFEAIESALEELKLSRKKKK